MSYSYETEKPNVFSEDGQEMFLRIRDWLKKSLAETGAARVGEIVRHAGGSGSSFTMLACIDRLVELKEFQYACKCGHGAHTYCIVELADHRFGCERHPNE